MQTRGSKKNTLRAYRMRVKTSKCRGKRASSCRIAPKCKLAAGKKRTFCRKTKNMKLHKNKNSTRKNRK